MHRTPRKISVLLAACALLAGAAQAQAADFALATKYGGGVNLDDYWVSEKFDGVRARWDGTRLISRGGNAFAAPAWFTDGFPATPLDGELWVGRGRFAETVSIVTRATPHEGWRKVRYRVFDLPSAKTFERRLRELRAVVAAAASPYLALVRQHKVRDHAALMAKLDAVTDAGGEGLMLRRARSRYRGGRSADLLKLKKFDDAEARVVAHNPGKGKFAGVMGSITVEADDGTRFKIGSGFTDAQRRDPPPPGSRVTFRHHGHTVNGLPRFPVFWRVRQDEPQPEHKPTPDQEEEKWVYNIRPSWPGLSKSIPFAPARAARRRILRAAKKRKTRCRKCWT